MPRTTITVQRLTAKTGQAVTFQNADAVNLMAARNTGAEVVLVQTGTGQSVTMTFPSVADPYGRTGDVGPVVVGANLVQAFGPFAPPSIWGDGVSQLYANPSALSGTPGVAVVAI